MKARRRFGAFGAAMAMASLLFAGGANLFYSADAEACSSGGCAKCCNGNCANSCVGHQSCIPLGGSCLLIGSCNLCV